MRFPAEIRSAFLAHFGVPAVCEAAHLDRSRQNNEISNAIILCSNCHKMLDWDLIFGDTIIAIRDRTKNSHVVETDEGRRQEGCPKKETYACRAKAAQT